MNETTTAVPLNVIATPIERLHAMIARQLRNNRIITINEYRFRFSSEDTPSQIPTLTMSCRLSKREFLSESRNGCLMANRTVRRAVIGST